MDKQTAKTPSSPFQSYHDYVSCLVREYPEYNWLHRFLSAPGALPSETRVQLIDSINNELRTKSFPMPHGVFNGNALREALAHRPAYITSRIVYVNYQESWSIDRAVIDVIGHYFQVNPLFFWGHLHHYYSSEDRFCPNDLRGIGNPTKPLWIAPLPSERISLELICVDTGLSALFLNANGSAGEGNTVIVFCRSDRHCISGLSRFLDNSTQNGNDDLSYISSSTPNYFKDHVNKLPSTRYEAALGRMSREDIHSADKNPVEYIYPFIRLLLIEVNSQVQELGYVLESQFLEGAAGEANTRILQGIWVRLHDIEVDMSASLDSLTNFASSNQTKTGPVLNDFKALMQHISHVQHDLREYLNRHVSMKSLEESRLAVIESRKSIELADSVKRLTQIALIFVPLNLVTSLFGMNFVEFGTGKLHVWIFVAVACLLCVIVAIAVFVTSSRGKLKSLGT